MDGMVRFSACCTASRDRSHIIVGPACDGNTTVKSMHISCQSDTYRPSHNYAGVIIYQYEGKSDWRTANNTHCKSGYIVIQDTGSDKVKKWIGKEPGAVHGAVYRNAFGESVSNAHVVGGVLLKNARECPRMPGEMCWMPGNARELEKNARNYILFIHKQKIIVTR